MILVLVQNVQAFIYEVGSGKGFTFGTQGGKLFVAQEFVEVTNVRLPIYFIDPQMLSYKYASASSQTRS